MAYCANCGHEISDLAATCPKCGQPTPAGAGTGELADFWSRLGAYLLDALILLIPGLIVSFAVPFIGPLAVYFLYDWLMHAYWDGQTLGKRVVNIRVTRPDGRPIDSGVSAARAAMEIVSGFPLGLGYLWAAWDPENRTWHDMVADTRVYRVVR